MRLSEDGLLSAMCHDPSDTTRRILISRGEHSAQTEHHPFRSVDVAFRMAIPIKTPSSRSCSGSAMVLMRGAFVAFEEIFEVWLGEFMGDQLVLVNARFDSEGGAMVRGYGSNSERGGRTRSTSSWDRMPSYAKS